MVTFLVWLIILATVPAWGVTLFKLLPWYRAGRVRGGYRTMFQALVALLSWYTSIVLIVFVGGNTWAGTMLTVLWTVGGLTWMLVATLKGTQRAIAMEHETERIEPEAVSGWQVRTRPQVSPVEAYAPPTGTAKQRSQRAQQALRKAQVGA